jgi:prefoldin alpha subunit
LKKQKRKEIDLSAPNNEEQIRKLIYELQLMQGSFDLLQQRLQVLQAAVNDLRIAEKSLESLEEVEMGTEILVPAGAGVFVNANIGNVNRVIVGVGAEVSIEMSVEDAKQEITGRLEELEKSSLSVQEQLARIASQMNLHQGNLRNLSAESRGELPSV